MTLFFFFNDTATTEIYTLSLHDALPICQCWEEDEAEAALDARRAAMSRARAGRDMGADPRMVERSTIVACRLRLIADRSEEHTSELQSRQYLVCRLLLEKKNTQIYSMPS